MRHKPKFGYKGLTIIMSHPSRFDNQQLMSGFAGLYFDRECLRPFCNRFQCDLRTLDTISEGFLEGTKCLLFLGEPALRVVLGITGNLNNHRGSVLSYQNIPAIPSYLPQDCMDMKASYEKENNPHLTTESTTEDNDYSEEGEDSGEKEHGKTKRSNFKFWLSRDVGKAISIVKNNGQIPRPRQININLYPRLETIFDLLTTTKGKSIYLDIETDIEQNLTCVGIGIDNNVYVVPFLRYNYTRAYNNLPRLLVALAITFQQNEIVVHNSAFDLLVLAVKYRIPLPRKVYDTMLAEHRCFPEAEHSLGHCISLWLYERFHKDEGIFMPHDERQETQLWNYNGKDVRTMMLIREAQDTYAKTIPGLADSISQSNDSVYPYLLNTLLGIHFDKSKVDELVTENDAKMTQLLRIIKFLVGYNMLPTSNKQCVNYFHNELGYKSVSRTDKGAPSLKGESMYKLKTKYPQNFMIDLCLKFRELSKQTGTLRATAWNLMERYHTCQQKQP